MSTLFDLAADLARAQTEFVRTHPEPPTLATLHMKNAVMGLKFARETIVHQNSALARIDVEAEQALEGKQSFRDALDEIRKIIASLP